METITKEQVEQAQAAVLKAGEHKESLQQKYEETYVRPKMRQFIGQCFKYRNCYSGGEPWWMFVQIVGVHPELREFVAVTAQKDFYGKITIQSDHLHGDENGPSKEYQPIDKGEFDRHWKAVVNHLDILVGPR